MADVGRLAGVSAATVSFVLNENSGQTISRQTRERVLVAAAQLDYRPNQLARGLRTRRTATIGFVIDEIEVEPHAGAIVLGAHEAAWSQGSLLMVVNTGQDETIVREVINELVNRPVDAIIFATVGTRRLSVPDALKGVPAILLNCYVTGGLIPSVLPDEVAGGRAATETLLTAGHRRIAYLTGPASTWTTRSRLRGFRTALAHAGANYHEQIVRRGNNRVDSGYQLTRALLAEPDPPTAIMCGNDRMALGVYLALSEAGLTVPRDISVIGYDDQVDLAARIHPPLTTVRLPYYQMGQWAARQVLTDAIGALPARTYLSCPVVERQSVDVPRVRG
jgi:LacI family transcriptional regulator